MTGSARVPASPYLDDPGRRLLWSLPLAALIWLALLIGFSRMLEQTAPPPPELKPLEARIVELPPEVGGLQGGPAPAAAAKPQPAVVKPTPVVHHRAVTHPRRENKAGRAARNAIGDRYREERGASWRRHHPEQRRDPSPPPGHGSTRRHGGRQPGAGLGSDTAGARAIYAPTPTIPDDLREDALDTVAVAHFKVGYDGVVDVGLVKPTSSPELNQILLDTLKQWKFFPAMRGGVAIASEFDIRIPITVQ